MMGVGERKKRRRRGWGLRGTNANRVGVGERHRGQLSGKGKEDNLESEFKMQ